MSAANVVMAARAAGIQRRVEGDDLLLEAAAAPPPAVMEQLSQHKPAIVLWLRPREDGWSAEDWCAFFDERSGIAEFDGGLPRAQAGDQALACCVIEWLNRNPECSLAGRCLRCGDREYAHDPLLPYGTEPTGHAWLHSNCWPAWCASREAKALSALAEMDIPAPDKSPNDFEKKQRRTMAASWSAALGGGKKCLRPPIALTHRSPLARFPFRRL